MMSLLRDMKFVSRDKSDDLTGVLSCRATLFECLRHNHLSLRKVHMMSHHKPNCFQTISKPDPSLFRTIPVTGDPLSNHALGIL